MILKAITTQLNGVDVPAVDSLGSAWNRVTSSGSTWLNQVGKQISEGLHLKDVLNGLANGMDRVAQPRDLQDLDAAIDRAKAPSRTLQQRVAASGRTMDDYRASLQQQRAVAAAPKAAPADDFNDRFAPALAKPLNTDRIDQQRRIDEVTEALRKQSLTAGMSAIEQEKYNLAVSAGTLTDKTARDAIDAKVNSLHALNDTREITDQIKGQTAATNAEAQSLNMTGAAAAAYRMEQEALSREKIKGVALSPDLIARIRAEGDAYRVASENLAQLRLQQSIGFDRAQLGRTDSEADVYNRLNAAGVLQNGQIASAAAAGAAQQIKLNQALTTTKGLVTDVVSGFAKDYRNAIQQGASATEALGTAGVNALGKIEDKLIDMATQQLVAKALGAVTGSGLLGSLFGIASAGSGGTAGNLPALHAQGGFIRGPGSGTSDSIPARLSNGEFVVKADAVAKHRSMLEAINSGNIPSFASGGLVGGSAMPPPRWSSGSGDGRGAPTINIYPVAGSTMDVTQNDDNTFTLVGRMIDNKIKSYDRSMPDRVAGINADPRRR